MNQPADSRSTYGPSRVLLATLATEQDIFTLRRRAKSLAEAIGLDSRDQVRLATAVSELGRDLLRPAAMTAVFTLHPAPAALEVVLSWTDDRVPSEESLNAVTRLLPETRHRPAAAGGRVEIAYPLPAAVLDPARIRDILHAEAPVSAIEDLRAQTQDLLASLQEAHAQRDELERLNEELTETNAGVMALYAELTVEHKEVVERYAEEHELALALQRTFLPTTLPDVPGVELAVRYLPATSTTEIGGDFYEAVQSPHGLLLAVGDVVGHSLKAATVMGELRHALRAYTAEGHPPHVLLERLDNLLHLHRPGWTATVCIILVEPGNRRVRIANAGHLPPLVVTADGSATYLERHGPLLGLNLNRPEAIAYDIAPGSRLLMITDGLIETRTSDLRDRLRLLSEVTAGGPPAPEALCDTLIERFGEQAEDDIIVFAALLHPAEAPPDQHLQHVQHVQHEKYEPGSSR
ncbi:PP2C family protein-serine/threonine phosphatase [Streptomyces sp. NPDC049040]|uniref:PP2C family protein-serine/threonine phosphatase n=1 Tax=Streptomyces sp. NPDC049040 TaxID=3365593 RepID=UPI0037177371